MTASLKTRLAEALGTQVVAIEAARGGNIASAAYARLADGREVFAKTAADGGAMFASEAEGLRELAKSGAIRVPTVIHVEPGLLVLEKITPAPTRPPGFERQLGRQLAQLHRVTSPSFGFTCNNFIGATPQQNLPRVPHEPQNPESTWPRFYLRYRLVPQVELMSRNGLIAKDAQKLCDRLEDIVADVLTDGPPSLLHGDLWSGNYLVGSDGEPVLIDPAVYYGHREAEFGMITLFSGLGRDFFAAYDGDYPRDRGHEDRLPLYQLYHLMNHANLFGRSYVPQVVSILQSYL